MSHFIFDCDDVLLDWMGGFRIFLRKMGFHPSPYGPTTWDMTHWLDMPQSHVTQLVQQFNQSYEFGHLKEIENARSTVWALHDQGHSLTVLTACGDSPITKAARRNNLSAVFGIPTIGRVKGPFDRIIILPLGASKFEFLYNESRHSSDMVLIEDNFRHAQSGVANGIKSYCIRKRHNRHVEATCEPGSQVIWIDDISEVIPNGR